MLSPRYLTDADMEALPAVPCPRQHEPYRSFLFWFMAHYMPGVPLDLVYDDESETRYEDWEIQYNTRVDEVRLNEILDVSYDEVLVGELNASTVADELEMPAEDLEDLEMGDTVGYVVNVSLGDRKNTITVTNEIFVGEAVADWLEGLPDGSLPADLANVLGAEGFEFDMLVYGDTVYLAWADEDIVGVYEVESDAEEDALERAQENMSAHPWAWNWLWYPADNIRDDDLLAAGFVVATYKGHRVCGIDGGGRSFYDAEHLRLAWQVAVRWRLVIPTEDGKEVRPV